MEYKLLEEFHIPVLTAIEIANTVPWYGDYVPAKRVESVLRLQDALIKELKLVIGKPGLAKID